jgi:hypothetical protein
MSAGLVVLILMFRAMGKSKRQPCSVGLHKLVLKTVLPSMSTDLHTMILVLSLRVPRSASRTARA